MEQDRPGGSDGQPTPDSDFVALAAYGSLAAFIRTAADAALAPELAVKEAMATLASAHFENYRLLTTTGPGAGTAHEVTSAFVPAVDAFHARTVPGDWLEGVVKAYLGAGLLSDLLEPLMLTPTGSAGDQVVRLSAAGEGASQALADVVRARLAADPRAAGRLALWGRRLAGEALSQAQRLATDRPGLFASVTSAGGDLDQSDELLHVGELFVRLTGRHAERLRGLGLTG